MAHRPEHISLLLDELERYGLKGQVSDRGKHLEVRWSTAHGERFVIAPRTPSDWRSGMNTRSDLRKLLKKDNLEPRPVHELSFSRAMSLPKPPAVSTAERESVLQNDVEALTDLLFELQEQIRGLESKLESMTIVAKVQFGQQPVEAMPVVHTLATPETKGAQIAKLLTYQYRPVSWIIDQAKGFTTAASVRQFLQKGRREGRFENGLRGMWRLKHD